MKRGYKTFLFAIVPAILIVPIILAARAALQDSASGKINVNQTEGFAQGEELGFTYTQQFY